MDDRAADDIWFNHSDNDTATLCHGTAIARDGQGMILLGPSGCGKSSLALQMIALGADLISDDRVWVEPGAKGQLVLSAPDPIKGRIEARGLGILQMDHVGQANLRFAVDLSRPVDTRCPDPEYAYVYHSKVRVLRPWHTDALASQLFCILRFGLIHEHPR